MTVVEVIKILALSLLNLFYTVTIMGLRVIYVVCTNNFKRKFYGF